MKRLPVILAVMIVLLAGCIKIMPDESPAATETPAAVSAPASPTEQASPSPTETATPAPTVTPAPTDTPAKTPELPVVTDRTIRYENEHIDADIHCPEISGLLDTVVEEDVNDSIYNTLRDWVSEIERESADSTEPAPAYYINTRFTVKRNDGVFLSIYVYTEYYTGGANVGTDLKFINVWNAMPGQQIALGDLFLPGADYKDLINGFISDKIAANPDAADYTFSSISGNQGFYLTDSALVIAFQKYDIAPGVDGPQEFSIPLEELGDVLIPELS